MAANLCKVLIFKFRPTDLSDKMTSIYEYSNIANTVFYELSDRIPGLYSLIPLGIYLSF